MVWFGFGLVPKILMVFLIAFFPVVIAAVVALSAMGIVLFLMVERLERLFVGRR